MNLGGAIQDSIKFARTADAGFDEEKMQQAACILAAEVERLRAELAAAKAASVCPVRVRSVWVDDIGGRVVAYCKNIEEAMKFEVWLRERMKDTTPPTT